MVVRWCALFGDFRSSSILVCIYPLMRSFLSYATLTSTWSGIRSFSAALPRAASQAAAAPEPSAISSSTTVQVTSTSNDDQAESLFHPQVDVNQLRRKLVAPSSHESPSFMHDPIAMKFVNCMMWDGKKSLSQNILKKALELVKTAQLSKLQFSGDSEVVTDPLKVFHQAIENSKPIMGTTGVRRGGKLYHVPYPLPVKRQQFLAIKWLIHAARGRKGHGMHNNLAAEILDAYNNQGTVIKKKQDLHRLAEANRAFAHFRW